MSERNSFDDGTLYRGWAIHIQRYEFAAQFCNERLVIDAGCGIGYGSHFLARHGATSVVGIDYSDTALVEARKHYKCDRLKFLLGNLEDRTSIELKKIPYNTIVHLENLEHLYHPDQFYNWAIREINSTSDGVAAIVSSPNGEVTRFTPDGKIANEFHIHEYAPMEFGEFLRQYFRSVTLYGQWERPEAVSRIDRERRLFDQLLESYYNPSARIGRMIKKVLWKKNLPPPHFTAAGESYPWEYEISALDDPPFPWKPMYLLAVCRGVK